MNLKDKLARLDKDNNSRKLPELSREQTTEVWIEDFQREFDAKILSENGSFVILKENWLDLDEQPVHQYVQSLDYIIPNFHYIFRESWTRNLNLRHTLFIDLETTGLSGGTGTYAFLIGMGYIELEHIVVKQYILPDFQNEWLMLKQVENMLAGFETVASFNGKSFDVPLLKNRFVLNRMDSILDGMNHLDILHAARRLWRRRLEACDLGNLEFAILGQQRVSDIPGELIPQAYFEYIRKRKALILRDVLEHNFHDIANMILLTLQIAAVVGEPLNYLKAEDDIYSLAKFLYQNNQLSQTKLLLSELQKSCQNPLLKKEVLFLLSMVHKRKGNVRSSRNYFKQLLSTQKDHPEALEELAKYYEHHEKNYTAALDLINQGLEYDEMLKQLGKASSLAPIKEDLFYRRSRLQRKLERTRKSQKLSQ